MDGFTESWNVGCPDGGQSAIAALETSGDIVWVKDNCADGKSGVAQVIYGNTHLICRNPHGVGTWAKCNWDWPENAAKALVAGVYDGNTGALDWEHGGTVNFTG